MSKPHKTDFMALIAGEVAPAARPEEPAEIAYGTSSRSPSSP